MFPNNLTMKIKILFVLVFFVPLFIQAQDSLKYATLSEVSDTVPHINFFGSNDPLEMTLKYDITSFIKNKKDGEYLDAEMTINYENIAPVTKYIRLKARGNFRRGQCYFPPIYLNFKTDTIKRTELEGIKKIKIVTHCSSSKQSEVYILREYLAYKLFNVLTDNSFRVRLLDITYVDTGKKQKNYEAFGFIIEPLELVAKRTESIEIEPTVVKGENIEHESADQVALFEYMIANTDWRFKGGHNIKYIKSLTEITDKVIAVPYDFDFSGFVDTYYSFPQEWATSIEEVKDREYLGYCRNNENYYSNNFNNFMEKKEEIRKTISTFEYLNEKERSSLVKYVDGFFMELERPERLIDNLKNQCRSYEF